MLGTIQLLLKTFFSISHSFDDINSERRKLIFFKGDFQPLNMRLSMHKKKVMSYFCRYFNISKAYLNQKESVG